MLALLKKNLFLLILLLVVLFFFQKTLVSGLLPIPSDTIVGLYHPFRDFYAKDFPRGIPFKNFLITDPVRQIIPWKSLVLDSLAKFELPLWNPYEMAGKPLLANFQSSPFYPFNLILFLKPFEFWWSIFIILQPLLSGIFLFAYLKNLKLDSRAALFGAISFAFGGFSIAWLEWGTIISTALWLPLILLSTDKIFEQFEDISKIKNQKSNIHIKYKKLISWFSVLLFSSVSSFFAGHLQIFFYLTLLSGAYVLFRWFENGKVFKILNAFLIFAISFLILTFVQWFPVFQFISLSARAFDQNPLTTAGWFLPWQNLIQFVSPDFFGNPATLNYYGVWNYGEFIGYIGVVGLFLAACSFLSKNHKVIAFFSGAIIVSLLFATSNPVSKLPFELSVPFISSAQPTRLIFLISFSLAVLAAFGLDNLIKNQINKKAILGVGFVFVMLFFVSWFAAQFGNLEVAKRNLIFPSIIFVVGLAIIAGFISVKNIRAKNLLIIGILILSFYDLYRFGIKFTPFTNPDYFYPSTSVIEFLQKDKSVFRIATTDSRLLAPNIATYYKIQSIEGYDPLYLEFYAEFIAANERPDHSVKPPFGFNRIITPHNVDSSMTDLLNVKYVLSLSNLSSPKFKKVFEEGETRIFENKNVFPRAFFVNRVIESKNKEQTMAPIFQNDMQKTAVSDWGGKENLSIGKAAITSYENNRVVVKAENAGDGFLVLTDSYYPTWHAKVDGKEVKIYVTDYAFRGIIVPSGKHTIVFYDTLF